MHYLNCMNDKAISKLNEWNSFLLWNLTGIPFNVMAESTAIFIQTFSRTLIMQCYLRHRERRKGIHICVYCIRKRYYNFLINDLFSSSQLFFFASWHGIYRRLTSVWNDAQAHSTSAMATSVCNKKKIFHFHRLVKQP